MELVLDLHTNHQNTPNIINAYLQKDNLARLNIVSSLKSYASSCPMYPRLSTYRIGFNSSSVINFFYSPGIVNSNNTDVEYHFQKILQCLDDMNNENKTRISNHFSEKNSNAQRLNALLTSYFSGARYINEEHLEEIFSLLDQETENLKISH